jgi:hypothetical protein
MPPSNVDAAGLRISAAGAGTAAFFTARRSFLPAVAFLLAGLARALGIAFRAVVLLAGFFLVRATFVPLDFFLGIQKSLTLAYRHTTGEMLERRMSVPTWQVPKQYRGCDVKVTAKLRTPDTVSIDLIFCVSS